MNTQTTDRIVKEIVLKASLSRVWKAVSDAREFGEWFKVDMSGAGFRPGQPVQATMTYPGYEGMPFGIVVAEVEPEEVDGGTKLTVTESGFDNIPLARRAEAFRMNSEGWAIQMENVRKYVEGRS